MGEDQSNYPSGIFDHFDDEGNAVDKNGLYVNPIFDGTHFGLPNGNWTLKDILQAVNNGLLSADKAYSVYKSLSPYIDVSLKNPFAANSNAFSTMPNWVIPLGIAAVAVIALKKNSKTKSKTINGMKNSIIDFGAANFKKEAMPTLTDIAVITGTIIAAQKFIDANKLPASMTTGTFAQGLIKHQGGAKAVLGFLIATTAKNHILKNVSIGIAIQGIVQEARVFFANTDGSNTIPSIGGVTTIRNASSNVIGQYRLPDGRILHGAIIPNETVRRSSSSVLAGKMMYRLPSGEILMGTFDGNDVRKVSFPTQQSNSISSGDYSY